MKKIILASSSPRRQELLKQLGIPFTVRAVAVDESLERDMPPGVLVEKLALRKARAAAKVVDSGLIIGSDTVVTLDNLVLGKPGDKNEALRMLESLQGRVHEVFTGLALVDAETGRAITGYECTEVLFRRAGRDELKAYVDTGEPMDKAGAYGIQGLGAIFVTEIQGCYYNVVGLPVAKLVEMLSQFGINVPAYWKHCFLRS